MTTLTLEEQSLYRLGPYILDHGGRLPALAPESLAHVVRGAWDRSGFVGLNNGGYPVVSLIAPRPLAADVSCLIEQVTGQKKPERPLHGAYWVGVSGGLCAPWLRFLYAGATVYSRRNHDQALTLIESLS